MNNEIKEFSQIEIDELLNSIEVLKNSKSTSYSDMIIFETVIDVIKYLLCSDIKKVLCIVEGGVVDFGNLPPGLEITVRDYDIDGVDEDELVKDEDGEDCIQSVYTA